MASGSVVWVWILQEFRRWSHKSAMIGSRTFCTISAKLPWPEIRVSLAVNHEYKQLEYRRLDPTRIGNVDVLVSAGSTEDAIVCADITCIVKERRACRRRQIIHNGLVWGIDNIQVHTRLCEILFFTYSRQARSLPRRHFPL